MALDVDILVTRSLAGLLDSARDGRLVAFVNVPPTDHRYFDEWSGALGLGPMCVRDYVDAGQVVIPARLNDTLLPPWIEAQKTLRLAATRYGRARLDGRRGHAQSVVRRGARRGFGVLGIRTRLDDRRRPGTAQ